MTSKTSFFNKAVYKSTIKRFGWGSVLYFAILFISVIINVSSINNYNGYYSAVQRASEPLILSQTYLTFPLLLSVVVPSITALLIFRFLHSKKQIIFIHAAPVSRRANYISSILAGLTLMAVPVVANALIYLIYFKPIHCLMWLGINLFSIFIMFSLAVFSSVITGNSFAMIVINILIHSFAAIILASLELIAQGFVYGFSSSVDLWNIISDNNFVVVIFGMANDFFRENISAFDYAKFVCISAIIYALSYFIYKKRKSETASDVAGFGILNHIFKYFVTFLLTLLTFVIFGHFISENIIVFIVILIIFSLISYFGSEMILKKSVNVLSSYKGYIGYVLVFSVIMIVFSCTSFFGYETRIPQKDRISEVCVYEYYYGDSEPYTGDSKLIDDVLKEHKKITEDIPSIFPDNYDTKIHIKYKLKNGRILSRTYPVTNEKRDEVMNKMYENAQYKMLSQTKFTDSDKILNIHLDGIEIKDKEGFMSALKEDVLNMSYSELTSPLFSSNHQAEIEYYTTHDGEKMVNYYYINISQAHTNTLRWIEENVVSETDN